MGIFKSATFVRKRRKTKRVRVYIRACVRVYVCIREKEKDDEKVYRVGPEYPRAIAERI